MKVLDLSISKSMILNMYFLSNTENAIFKWLVHKELNNILQLLYAKCEEYGFRTLWVTNEKPV